ncbi:hypothetical protein [Polaromonas vacuolata]|uniref:hypothetical protein n=1 Tax=Polaromonas vacuolata TaxID=37448 RepID=UPI0014567B2F|nr:hypothetical protein [Polaromonas vacuolata]
MTFTLSARTNTMVVVRWAEKSSSGMALYCVLLRYAFKLCARMGTRQLRLTSSR